MALTLEKFISKRVRGAVKRNTRFLILIVMIDLFPLWAIYHYGWSVVDVVYLFFLETSIFAIFAVLKIKNARNVLAIRFVNRLELSKGRFKSLRAISEKIQSGALTTTKVVAVILFLILVAPLVLGELALLNWLSGVSYFRDNFANGDILEIGVFWWILGLLLLEHAYVYRKKYVLNLEFQSTGVMNEFFAILTRIVVQQIVLVFALLLSVSNTLAVGAAVVLFSSKLIIDVVAFHLNRKRNEPLSEDAEVP